MRVFPRFLFVLILGLAATACSRSQTSPDEATAQADRAMSLATQMANYLKATREVENLQAEATIQAVKSLLQEAEGWPLAIEDHFDNNALNWPTGDGEDPLALIHWEIQDGQYRWQATANDPFVWWTLPDMETYSNFYLGIDLQQLAGPPDGEAGLIFRQSEGDYYLFEINGSRQYAVYFHNQDGWETLLDWTGLETIKADTPNRLSVIADREFFLLFINDRYLTTLFDDRLASGSAGVLAGLSNAGDQGLWMFDNFVLRTQDGSTP